MVQTKKNHTYIINNIYCTETEKQCCWIFGKNISIFPYIIFFRYNIPIILDISINHDYHTIDNR